MTATDSGGQSIVRQFEFPLIDVAEPPTAIALSSGRVFAGTTGVWVGQLNVVDPEGLEGLTLNVDDPRFEIRSGQLYLRNEALTEPPGTRITIEISATDALANQTFSQQISLIADDGPTDWDLPGQWKFDPLDVNADGFVTPLDALLVIIRLNAARAGQVTTPSENKPVSQFYDASGDDIVSPLDSL